MTNVELQLSFANPFTTPSPDLVLSGDLLAAARTDDITGYATPVPEPSTGFTALMGALAVLGLARIRKFRL
ncbi:MAG: PEP-CTERM sorting domain-containing protein [Bryobacteraceae bacterium]